MKDGVKVQIGEKEYVMPRLSAGGLKKHWPTIKALRKRVQQLAKDGEKGFDDLLDAAPELMSAQIALIHSALKRNYPDISVEEIEDGLELPDVKKIFEKLVILSNMEKVESVEGNPGKVESPQS